MRSAGSARSPRAWTPCSSPPATRAPRASRRCSNVDIAAGDIDGLARSSRLRENVALTIVGPEAPLVAGIVDRFMQEGCACFGPTRAAARLEGSKAYTKAFLQRVTASRRRVTPRSLRPTSIRISSARSGCRSSSRRTASRGQGRRHLRYPRGSHRHRAAACSAGRFGAAGNTVVIEEFLRGEEVSFIVVAAGEQVIPLATSQDHKRRDDGDQGPNTGGMGAYSPAPIVTPALACAHHARGHRAELARPDARRHPLSRASCTRGS